MDDFNQKIVEPFNPLERSLVVIILVACSISLVLYGVIIYILLIRNRSEFKSNNAKFIKAMVIVNAFYVFCFLIFTSLNAPQMRWSFGYEGCIISYCFTIFPVTFLIHIQNVMMFDLVRTIVFRLPQLSNAFADFTIYYSAVSSAVITSSSFWGKEIISPPSLQIFRLFCDFDFREHKPLILFGTYFFSASTIVTPILIGSVYCKILMMMYQAKKELSKSTSNLAVKLGKKEYEFAMRGILFTSGNAFAWYFFAGKILYESTHQQYVSDAYELVSDLFLSGNILFTTPVLLTVLDTRFRAILYEMFVGKPAIKHFKSQTLLKSEQKNIASH